MNPLKNLTVIELSSVLAGPSVGLFFAEQGARVIKVENPNFGGDVTRSWKLESESKEGNVSAYFSSVNYNKEYLALNLKKESDQNKLHDLLHSADILLTNFKHGDAEKFKLDYNSLKAKFPQLILGEINGFGAESDRVAYDLVLQAESGFMFMNGQSDSPPTKMPVALIDVLAGHQLKEGLLVALLKRSETGKGCRVHVSLYDSALASLVNQASNYLMEGYIPQRIGSLHPNIAPYGEVFTSLDGKFLTFAIGSQKQFMQFCHLLDLTDVPKDNNFSSNQNRIKNREQLKVILQEKIQGFNADELLEKCHQNFIPAAEIKDLKAVFKDQSAQELILEEEIEGVLTKRVKSVVFKIVD